MNRHGDAEQDILVRSRAALLDALDALKDHRDSVVVIGAQAIYLRTSSAPVALAETTKDSDLVLDPRILNDSPLIEEAMAGAGFVRNLNTGQPGAWLNADGVPVDLMVPERLAGAGGKQARAGRLPPHDRGATRRARGLEAAVADADLMEVGALDPADARSYEVRVAGVAALLVAKTHKIAERNVHAPQRLVDKDAHDIYRILIDTETDALAVSFTHLLQDELAGDVTKEALAHIGELFAAGPDATGSMMAGRAETGVGEPETVSLQTSILASDLLVALER